MRYFFKKILQTSILICIGVLVLEGGTRLILSSDFVYNKIIKNECDATWRWRWVKRHKAGAPMWYAFDQYDPTRGWSLRPNISNKVCFENKILNSNSKGIRGKDEYAYDKHKFRIVLIGDSFTFGDEVSDDETYPYYLQQVLPEAEVINLGVHGYGHDQMLIYLREEGIKYNPDIVILGYRGQDADRNMLEFRDYLKPKFELSHNKLRLVNNLTPPDVILEAELWRLKHVDLWSILFANISRKMGLYQTKREKLTKAILKDIAATAKRVGATPVFVYLDDIKASKVNGGLTIREQVFQSHLKEMGVNYLFPRFYFLEAAQQDRIQIKRNGHFDAQTNRVLANGIKETI